MHDINDIDQDRIKSLNQTEVELIVQEIFVNQNIERPSCVKFESLPIDSLAKPSAELSKGILTIRAASEVEARKVVCLEASRQKWSWMKWTLATRVGVSVLIACVVYVVVLMAGWILYWTLPEGMRILGYVATGVLLIIPLYLMMKMPVWSRPAREELLSNLLDANGVSEYETDYTYLDYSIIIGFGYWVIYLICGFFMLLTIETESELRSLIFLTMTVSVFLLMGPPYVRYFYNEKKYNHCFEYEKLNIFNQERPEGMTTPEAEEVLEAAFELFHLMEIEHSFHPVTGEVLPIDVAFHKIPLPMCRNCDYSFEDERVILDIRDTNTSAAKRLLASKLVWQQVVLPEPMGAAMGSVLSGLVLPLVMAILCLFIGMYTLALAPIGLTLFFIFMRRSMEIRENTRQAVHSSLERTELFSPRLLSIYAQRTLPEFRKFTLLFASVVIILYAFMIWIVLISL